MKFIGKHYGSLFIAIYLLSPLATLAFAYSDTRCCSPAGTCLSFRAENSDDPVRSHSGCATEDNDANYDEGSCPGYMDLISLFSPYAPLDTRLEIIETYRELPVTYALIFVPPQ